MDSTQTEGETSLDQPMSSLSLTVSLAPTAKNVTTQEVPPHRSHDPENSLKRSDPFQFGSRFLKQEDDVFEFNAWDHVETDDDYKEYAELQYAKQREAPVSEFDKKRFNSDPAKWWNQFYKNNTVNFFKDRKWLQQEFPVLSKITQADSGSVVLLEVGAGAGNTAYPILAHNHNPNLKIHACDFSKKAVDLIRKHDAYDLKNIQADVWDVAGDELPADLTEGSVDIVVMIFIFSALAPSEWARAVENVFRLLKPGGEVLFRDYGRGDLAQVRFKKGRYLEENFYIRGDGTRVYFFDEDELSQIWTGKESKANNPEDHQSDGSADQQSNLKTGFEVIDLGVDRRLLVNRAQKTKMYRCWLQGRFRKPVPSVSAG
ncbi:hypothetical protein B7463_g1679, partial [Scytalidium lignicola]